MEIRFGIQDNTHTSKPVSSQQMINCYLEPAEPGSRTMAAVVPSYGAIEFSDIPNPKGANQVNGVLYVQDANTLYKVIESGAATSLGAIVADDDVIIEGDGINVVVATNDKGFVYDGITTEQITDPDFPVPQWIGYLDGYFPLIEKGTGKIWINETAYDPKNWNALDFASAEGNPDDLVWGIVEKREVILFGKYTTSIWYNSGNADFPLARTTNGFIETGIYSKWASAKVAEGVYFVGNDGIIYQLNGYAPQRISNSPIERLIEGYSNECRCIAWKEGGHPMVAFNFPEACHVYDASTGLWHRRRTYQRDNWRNNFAVNVYNKHMVGGQSVGYLDESTFTEYSGIMRAQCNSATVNDKNNLVFHDLLELNFDSGYGGEVMLRFSDDGGHTWSRERTASIGETGEYKNRVKFHALGSSRDRVYEYSISDPYRRTLINAYLNEWG